MENQSLFHSIFLSLNGLLIPAVSLIVPSCQRVSPSTTYMGPHLTVHMMFAMVLNLLLSMTCPKFATQCLNILMWMAMGLFLLCQLRLMDLQRLQELVLKVLTEVC